MERNEALRDERIRELRRKLNEYCAEMERIGQLYNVAKSELRRIREGS